MSNEISWYDLLGTPYLLHGSGSQGLDCMGIAETVLSRAGIVTPPSAPWRGPKEETEPWAFDAYFEASSWDRLGDTPESATAVGDLVLTGTEGGAQGVFVMVSAQTRTFLTAQPGRGVTAFPLSGLMRLSESVLGVYRKAARVAEDVSPEAHREALK